MGQKTHPFGFRVGINEDWKSNWFSKNNYKEKVLEDQKIRRFLEKRLQKAGLAGVTIERSFNELKITLHVARPGVVIGRGGAGIEDLSSELEALAGQSIDLNVLEVKDPDTNAELVAQNIAMQLERRRPFRRVMSYWSEKVMSHGVKGVKIMCKGRLGGTEIARSEEFSLGTIPLQSLRAKIDYSLATAYTKKGTIGVKVWIYKGDYQ